ncbi:MAG TPA: YbaK/EbsC family protein [Candidatus Saccharimonadales bacterium]|nr:YbaK/EbsC family protein [Candidatus Saccharimonadales bacterium]
MKLGKLDFVPAEDRPDLLSEPVKAAIQTNKLSGVLVAEIDPQLADTAAFCEKYDIGLDISANCVVVEAKRADKTWYAGCLILATSRADINGVIRKQLEARKVSFAPTDMAISLSKMEYGGITPIGLPDDWTLLVDTAVVDKDYVVIGSGVRKSKLLIPGKIFASMPNTTIMSITQNT